MTNSLTFFEVTGNYDAVSDPSVSGDLNSPIVAPINALVSFTPRLPVGQLCYVSDYLVTTAYNAEQTIFLVGSPTGGTFVLSFGGYETDPLAWDISPTDLQTALEGLTSIGSGNVTVVADASPQAYDIEFTGTLGDTTMPAIGGNADELTNAEGSGFCEITTTITADGSPQVVADTAIALPALTARIFSGVLSTIDFVDTPGFQLTSNSAILGLNEPLIYDVLFSSATYNSANQQIAPFAFTAPIDDTGVCITDPGLTLLTYQPPITTMWTPPSGLSAVRNWRQRAC